MTSIRSVGGFCSLLGSVQKLILVDFNMHLFSRCSYHFFIVSESIGADIHYYYMVSSPCDSSFSNRTRSSDLLS